jgi:hypothetical protein
MTTEAPARGSQWRSRLNAKAIGFSALAPAGGFGSAIAGQPQAGEARQHHRPSRGFGDTACIAKPHHLPGVVDAQAKVHVGPWEGSQVDGAAATATGLASVLVMAGFSQGIGDLSITSLP